MLPIWEAHGGRSIPTSRGGGGLPVGEVDKQVELLDDKLLPVWREVEELE